MSLNEVYEQNPTISRSRAIRTIREHGVSVDEFLSEMGDTNEYKAVDVLEWLGVLTMAQIIQVAANSNVSYDAMSLSHVHCYGESVSLEIPYFDGCGAKSVYLVMSKVDALELATRLTSAVSQAI